MTYTLAVHDTDDTKFAQFMRGTDKADWKLSKSCEYKSMPEATKEATTLTFLANREMLLNDLIDKADRSKLSFFYRFPHLL